MKNINEEQVAEKFVQLPKVVQDAVLDSKIEMHLRTLAKKHKMHIDQWVVLENEIMLTLLDFHDVKDMPHNIKKGLGMNDEDAQAIVSDIAEEIFAPIQELLRNSSKKQDRETKNPMTERKKTPSDTTAYKPGETSSQRQNVDEDPYRESLDN